MRERDHLLQVEAAVCEKREAQDGKQPPLVRAEPPNVLNRSVHGHVRVGGAVAVAAPPRVRHRRRLQLRAPPRKQHGGGEHGASAGAGNARLRRPADFVADGIGSCAPAGPARVRARGPTGMHACENVRGSHRGRVAGRLGAPRRGARRGTGLLHGGRGKARVRERLRALKVPA